MKKIISITGLILIIAFTPDYQQPKLFKVEADINTWNKIIEIIDLSVADPKERVAVKNFIIDQLNKQLKIPQLPDSSNKQKK